jgi:hypothetical protein
MTGGRREACMGAVGAHTTSLGCGSSGVIRCTRPPGDHGRSAWGQPRYALITIGAGPPKFEGLRAGIEVESDCDQVTSDMGLGLEGCKCATPRADCSSLPGPGSLDGSRNSGRVLDHIDSIGAAMDEGPGNSRNGTALPAAGAVSTSGGRLVALECARGIASVAGLKPLGSGSGTTTPRGS